MIVARFMSYTDATVSCEPDPADILAWAAEGERVADLRRVCIAVINVIEEHLHTHYTSEDAEQSCIPLRLARLGGLLRHDHDILAPRVLDLPAARSKVKACCHNV